MILDGIDHGIFPIFYIFVYFCRFFWFIKIHTAIAMNHCISPQCIAFPARPMSSLLPRFYTMLSTPYPYIYLHLLSSRVHLSHPQTSTSTCLTYAFFSRILSKPRPRSFFFIHKFLPNWQHGLCPFPPYPLS